MTSLNYGVFGKPFNLEGTFRVLRMESLPSENLYYDEVAECGAATNANELRPLIAMAKSLQFVDFGNGLIGLHAECDGFMCCVVPEFKESGITDDQRPPQSENSDDEEIF
jgi:hypothetical protein